MPLLAFLLNSEDEDELSDTLWSLTFISDGPSEKIQGVLDLGILPRLVELVKYNNKIINSFNLESIINYLIYL